MDTSGSTAGALSDMKRSIHEIVGMLGPADRFRLLTIGHSVYESIRWTPGGTQLDLTAVYPLSGISLVYDALYAAVQHDVPLGRRHLVVALTDGDDVCSVVRPKRLREVVGRTEAVVHWIPFEGLSSGTQGAAWCNVHAPDEDIKAIDALVDGSGGQTYSGGFLRRGASPVRAFKHVLDDYRQSYVLYFTPEGVPRDGWHALKVEVPSGRFTIRARSGYFGGTPTAAPE
jgi:hypothetical protein